MAIFEKRLLENDASLLFHHFGIHSNNSCGIWFSKNHCLTLFLEHFYCCFYYLIAASMYRLHNTSEHGSGVTNMYSLSNAASRAATPLQIGGNDHLVLISSGNHDHMHHHHHHHHQGTVL